MLSSDRPPVVGPPTIVSVLGYGGLLPFVGLALGHLIQPEGPIAWADWLLAYGAVILSFVGALHWGFAMTIDGLGLAGRAQRFAWSVVPALIGFAALILSVPLGLTLLVVGFALAYWQDAVLCNRVSIAPWYPKLRMRLSLVAGACLMAGLA